MSDAADPHADIDKAATTAMQALSVLYKVCHSKDPGGALCDAVHQIMQATAEIERHVKSGMDAGAEGSAPEEATEAPAFEQLEDPMGDESAAPPMGSSSFAGPAQEMQSMMAAAAAKRKQP